MTALESPTPASGSRGRLGSLDSAILVSIRSLSRQRLFAIATVLTLALGLGTATALFSVMDQVIFRKPYPQYERLVVFGAHQPMIGFVPNSYTPQILPCLDHGQSFEAFAINAWDRGILDTGSETLGGEFARVNPDFFPLLGGKAGLGRLFGPDDFRPGAEEVAVLSHSFWQKELGSDPDVIGRNMRLEGRPCKIVGVLSRRFMPASGMAASVYTPLRLQGEDRQKFAVLATIARLKPGVTLDQADAEGSRLAASAELPLRLKDRFKEAPLRVKRLSALEAKGDSGARHLVFLGAVGILFAVSFLNALHLMLVRLSERRRELGIRMALGALPWNLMRLIGLESLVLMVGAGVLGLALAYGMIPVIVKSWMMLESEVALDARAFLFLFMLGLASAGLLTALSAWKAVRTDPERALKEDGTASGEGKGSRRWREVLVISNAALAMLLLTGTGLMTRSIRRMTAADRGFMPQGRVAVWLNLPRDLQGGGARQALIQRLEERLRLLPGVQDVGCTNTVPLAGMSITEIQKPDGTMALVSPNPATAVYDKALGLRLMKGRWIPQRSEGITGVVVVNRAMATLFFGDEDCIGKSLSINGGRPWTVIGLVDNTKDALRRAPGPQFYYPTWQDDGPCDILSVLVNCGGKPSEGLIRGIRRAIHDAEPRAGIQFSLELDEIARRESLQEKGTAALLQVISLVATALALTGLFSVMAYGVQKREREFGLRMALGASPRRLFIVVMQRGLVLGLLGVAAGLFGAWALTRFLTSLLYETSPLEPSVFVGMALLLLGALLLAAVPPAWRAARLAPARLMRDE